MHIFQIQANKETRKWFKRYKICQPALSFAITCIFNDSIQTKKIKKTKLKIIVDRKNSFSSYVFKTNTIFLCEDPLVSSKKRRQKMYVIFLHLLHEFRHWIQSEIYKVKDSELKYTDEDAEKNKKNYRSNQYEKDANLFERKNIEKFCKYYTFFKIFYQ